MERLHQTASSYKFFRQALTAAALAFTIACQSPQSAAPTPTSLIFTLAPTITPPNATPVASQPNQTAEPANTEEESQDATATQAPAIIQTVDLSLETPVTQEAFINDFGLTPIPDFVDPNALHPPAEIKIYRPGPLSKITSPLRVVANLEPSPDGQILVELRGEDGRTLSRKLIVMDNLIPGFTTGTMVTEIDFEVKGVAELGRLEISTVDEFDRPKNLASIDIILLSVGIDEIADYGDLQTNIDVKEPVANARVNGGILTISGEARLPDGQPLIVEMIDEQGNLVGSGTAAVVYDETNDYQYFSGQVQYTVDKLTHVRLIVKARGGRIPGFAYWVSFPIALQP